MADKPRKYYYNNPETGGNEEISKETHDFMQRFLPRVKKGLGQVFVAGTGDDEFKDLFFRQPKFDGSDINPLENDEIGLLPTRKSMFIAGMDPYDPVQKGHFTVMRKKDIADNAEIIAKYPAKSEQNFYDEALKLSKYYGTNLQKELHPLHDIDKICENAKRMLHYRINRIFGNYGVLNVTPRRMGRNYFQKKIEEWMKGDIPHPRHFF